MGQLGVPVTTERQAGQRTEAARQPDTLYDAGLRRRERRDTEGGREM